MIELYVENRLVDLTGSERILADYQIGSINNIGQKDTTRTIEFELPLTANNLSIFGSANIPLNASIIPYRMLDAYLLDDGIDMKIYLCQVLSFKDTIRVRLFGNNSSFAAAIRDKKLTDLDLSEYDHYWAWDTIETLLTTTEGVNYPVVDYGDLDTAGNQFYLEQCFPAVYLVTLVKQMCIDHGYTLTGNWQDDQRAKKFMLPFCNNKTAYHEGYTENFLFSAGNETEDVHYVPGVDYPIPSGPIIKFETEVSDPGDHYGYDAGIGAYCYTVEKNVLATFHVKLSLRVVSGTVSDYSVRLYRKRAGVTTQIWGTSGETAVLDDGIGVDVDMDTTALYLKNGDQLYITAHLVLAGVLTYLEFLVPGGFDANGNPNDYFSMVKADPYGPIPGDWWEVAANLPAIPLPELFKFVLGFFGCLYVVNEEDKTVNISFFDTIPGNKAIAKNWSGLIDKSEAPEIEYLLENYAKLNHCKYLDEDGINKPIGTDYDIVIDNDTLEPEKDLYVAPFGATLMNYKLDQLLHCANIDLQVVDYTSMASVQPRLLIANIRDDLASIDFVLAGDVKFSITEGNVPYFYQVDKDFNAGWQWSAETYQPNLIDTINQYRVVKQLIRLKPGHVNQHEWFVPVWIDEFMMYFYVDVIEEYEYGGSGSTLVHLIPLPENGEYYG